MKKEVAQVSTTKRYTVFADENEVLKTSNHKTAQDKVAELQKLNHFEIILSDENKKKAVYYTKTIYQQNYRIEAGEVPQQVSVSAAVPAAIK